MNEYLKGNYDLPLKGEANASSAESKEEEFYHRALEKLGGSIAFILKPKYLLWRGDKDGSDRH